MIFNFNFWYKFFEQKQDIFIIRKIVYLYFENYNKFYHHVRISLEQKK